VSQETLFSGEIPNLDMIAAALQCEPSEVGLLLKVVGPGRKAFINGWQWPGVGDLAVCPDWVPLATTWQGEYGDGYSLSSIGNGLHGSLWGEGALFETYFREDAISLVCAVSMRQKVTLPNEIKVPRAWVLFEGRREKAAQYLLDHSPKGWIPKVIGQRYDTENALHMDGGHLCVLKGGPKSTLSGRRHSVLVGGNGSTLRSSGDYSTLVAGSHSYLRGQHESHLTAGPFSFLEAGTNCVMTAGVGSIMRAGKGSKLSWVSSETTTTIYTSYTHYQHSGFWVQETEGSKPLPLPNS